MHDEQLMFCHFQDISYADFLVPSKSHLRRVSSERGPLNAMEAAPNHQNLTAGKNFHTLHNQKTISFYQPQNFSYSQPFPLRIKSCSYVLEVSYIVFMLLVVFFYFMYHIIGLLQALKAFSRNSSIVGLCINFFLMMDEVTLFPLFCKHNKIHILYTDNALKKELFNTFC